jgi:hypothetical protein
MPKPLVIENNQRPYPIPKWAYTEVSIYRSEIKNKHYKQIYLFYIFLYLTTIF